MPTDNDRREVARRLRELGLNPWDDAACEIALCADIACCNSECHGSNETPECMMALCDRLADLLDPPDYLEMDDEDAASYAPRDGGPARPRPSHMGAFGAGAGLGGRDARRTRLRGGVPRAGDPVLGEEAKGDEVSEELMPCPFCGGEARIIAKPYEPKFCVGCDDDTCLGFSGLGWLYDSEQEAAEAWNRRAERTCRVGCYPPGYEDNLHYEVCDDADLIEPHRGSGERSILCAHCENASWCGCEPGDEDGGCDFEPSVTEGEPPYNLYTLYEAVFHRSPRCWACIEDDEVDELVDALLDICNSPGHENIQRPQSSEPKVRCVSEVKVDGERLEELVHDAAVKLTGIDRDALLALADELSGDVLDVPAVYGTYLGGYVAACQDVARRIREACGEES